MADLRSQLESLQNPNSNEGERTTADWMVTGGRPGSSWSGSGAGAGAGGSVGGSYGMDFASLSPQSSGIQTISSSVAPTGPHQADSWSPEGGYFRNPSVGGSGSGSSGSGSGSNASTSANTPVNPMQKHAYDAASNYESGLASGTNEEIQRELGRARDEISVGMEREGQAAMGRGADPTFFKNRALEAGRRNMHELQGRLADVALGRREGAVRTLSEAAGSAAGEQRMMHLGTMDAQLGQQRVALEEADQRARTQEAPYNRLSRLMDAVGRYRDMLGDGGISFSTPSAPAGGIGGDPNFRYRRAGVGL